jgi:integrase/recombinase XerD
MTPLRAKFIQDLVIRGRSKNTQKAYTRCVCDLARYYRRSPELISYEEVTGWLHHLIKERQLAASSVNIAVSAVRFLYGVTLGRETLDLMASVSDMKRATGRAEVYARSEVEAILDSAQAVVRPTCDTITSQIHPGSGHSWPLKKHSGSLCQVRP